MAMTKDRTKSFDTISAKKSFGHLDVIEFDQAAFNKNFSLGSIEAVPKEEAKIEEGLKKNVTRQNVKKTKTKQFRKISRKRLYLKYSFSFVGAYFLLATVFVFSGLIGDNEEIASLIKPEVKGVQTKAEEIFPTDPTIKIPGINTSAPIIFVNSKEEKEIQKGLANGVIHYPGTALPGEKGNVFITGHSSDYFWKPGKYKDIFANLDKVQVGDTAIIYFNGKKHTYQAESKSVVEPNDLSVLAQTEDYRLTLMTCAPTGTDLKRLVIVFKLMS